MPDLEKFSRQCQFHNCQHQENAKGCYFSQTNLSNEIKTRYQSYLRFKDEIDTGKEWDKEH